MKKTFYLLTFNRLPLTALSLIALLLLAVSGCHGPAKPADPSVAFEQYKQNFVEDLWSTYPGWATGVGYHKYDSILNIPGEEERKREDAFLKRVDDSLAKYDLKSLTANDKTDYKLIQNFVASTRFYLDEFKEYEWNPASYNVGGDIFNVMDYRQAPLDQKLRNISHKLANVPAYFEAAKKLVKNPTKEHTELGINQNKGSLYFFDNVLPDSLKVSGLSQAEKDEFMKRNDAAKAAVNGYISWLEKEVKPGLTADKARSFRIGKDLYAKKFKFDIYSHYSSDEIYKKALERKDVLHHEMAAITDSLWPKYFATVKAPADTLARIRMMVDKLSEIHCHRDSFLTTIEHQLPELVQFINTHHIIDLDSTKPLKVRKTPEYQEGGGAGASINSPGPYDKDAACYYNVTPLTKYTAEDAESYLREYNQYVLQILDIHEAIPGHYTQGVYANRSPSIIKGIFGNGAMVEGWACYVERMMVEQGYAASPEMRLFYDKWNLRELCNTLLDYNIQCNNWTEEQVKDLLVREAFQQNTEAKEKYKRATLTQVQLASYFTGLTEIYELREEIKKKEGSAFDLKKFHEKFLSYGSAPVKEIRELMLQ